MRIRELDAVIRNCVTLGMLQYKAMIEPQGDRIKLSEAKRYVMGLGLPSTFIKACEDRGVLHRRKDGEKRNCTVYFSRRELQKCVVESKVLDLASDYTLT